jgi:hypothetical protein
MIVSYIGDNVKEFRFYTSNDLYNWRHTCSIDDMYECPEFIKFDVEGVEKWVLFQADNQYLIGSFNGEIFVPDHNNKYKSHFGIFNASQCFTNCSDNIQIGNLMFINYKDREFKFKYTSINTFSLPLQLNLIKLNGDYELDIKFITNSKPYIYEKLEDEINVINEHIIINEAECNKLSVGLHDIDLHSSKKKHKIEIIIDNYIYEMIVDDILYFAYERHKEINSALTIKKIE